MSITQQPATGAEMLYGSMIRMVTSTQLSALIAITITTLDVPAVMHFCTKMTATT